MRLVGKFGESFLSFEEVAPNKFECKLPIGSGKHYITLYAIDEAGNMSSQVHSMALVDYDNLKFQILESDKQQKIMKNDYSYNLIEGEYNYKLITR